MFINPEHAIKNNWISYPPNIVDDPLYTRSEFMTNKCIQPNAIDFTLDRVFEIDTTVFVLSEDSKTMRERREVQCENDELWELSSNQTYDCLSDMYVNLPENVSCMLIPRSTLNRNGVFLTSGLYDSGYSGYIGFALHVRQGNAFIAPGTRVGQIIFISSDNSGLYTGGYNHTADSHWM
jgi:deoxycytidine triphosphate deaminase